MPPSFSEVITNEAAFREVMGDPAQRVVDKVISTLDEHCRAFIAKSPFVLIGSAGGNGHMDVSPKGDPPGFVQVLDDQTLAIPDRVGNRRADTFRNLLANPQIGLCFLIPGKQETLRINGSAMIVRDAWLREQMVVRGKMPDFAIVVTVAEGFFHCAKCMIRSQLWDQTQWPEQEGLSSLARVMVDHSKSAQSVEEMQATIDQSYRDRLY